MKAILISLVVLFGFISYSNCIQTPFVWDDEFLIVQNPAIKDLKYVPWIFTHRIHEQANFYRPIQMFIYSIEHSIGQLDFRIYHLGNIFIHILVALMIFWLAYLLLNNLIVSFISSALFVTHPIHTEAVTYISGLADPLATLFMLLAMIFYIKYSNNFKDQKSLVVCFISFLLALLSKESAMILPFLLVAYDLIYKGKKGFSFREHVPFFSIMIFYLIIRKTFLYVHAPHASDHTTFLQRLPAVFQSLHCYFQKLLIPTDLHMNYRSILPSIWDPAVIFGFVLLVFMIGLLIRSVKMDKPVAFLLSWFLIQFLPISNIFPLNFYIAEHWIYSPSIGLFILFGYLCFKIYERTSGFLKGLLIVGCISIFCLSSFLTIKQNETYSTKEGFYKRLLIYNPYSYRITLMLGDVYFDQGKSEEAIVCYTRAIELNPKFVDSAYFNRGIIYAKRKDYNLAIEDFIKGSELRPNDPVVYNTLGVFYLEKKDFVQAQAAFNMSLSLASDFKPAHYNLLQVKKLLDQNEKDIIK